jgi:hypothetical protein
VADGIALFLTTSFYQQVEEETSAFERRFLPHPWSDAQVFIEADEGVPVEVRRLDLGERRQWVVGRHRDVHLFVAPRDGRGR